jgi:apolipoprotein N-acyltransferase
MSGGRRAYALVVASGLLLALAFPEPDLAPLALIALAPLWWTLRGASVGRGFGLGFAFGLGFFSLLIFWISVVGYVAYVLLVLKQAMFLGLFGAGAALMWRLRSVAARVVGVTVLWVAIELLRASVPVVGFTWGQLAQSQHDMYFWTLRPAAYGGAWMVAALLVSVNALWVEALRGRGRDRAAPALAGVALLAAPLLLPVATSDGTPLTVAVVQGNVPRDFQGSFYERELAITRSHVRLTEALDPEGLDLVVWPESAVGIDLRRDPVAAAEVSRAARSAGVPMIVGGNLDIDAGRYKVVAFLVSPEGEIEDIYQKTHLVPFGEYVPGRDLLGWIPMLDQVPRDAVPGDENKVFELPQGPIATVISFEGDFGSLVRRPIAAGGRALIVATNTSTWENSWASEQHLAFSQVRAAENGVDVVHAALSGTSGFIEAGGRTVEQTALFEATSLVHTINFSPSISFYARTGDWFAYLCVALAGVSLAAATRRRGDNLPG